MPRNNTIKVATYNILFSLSPEKIVGNISLMKKKGIIVFCLQEVVRVPEKTFIGDLILKKLGPEWKMIIHIGDETGNFGLGTAIIWNNTALKLKKSEKINLPKIKKIAFHEWLFSKIIGGKGVPFERRSIIASFVFGGKKIMVANLHLDNVGGAKHRNKQLLFLLSKMSNTGHENQILCGDFNTFDLLKTGREKKMLTSSLNPFKDVSDNIDWTADIHNTDTGKTPPLIKALIKYSNFHIRRKLDYVWAKNLKVIDCRKLNLEGSDHLPVVATLSIGG